MLTQHYMASLSIRRLEDQTLARLKARAKRDSLTLEETVRRILRAAVVDEESLATAIRRIVGKDGSDLELPKREVYSPINFASDDYGPDQG